MFSGDRLAELRKDKGLRQKDLADKLGITEQALGNYERGKHRPSVDLLYIMARFFNISADYLLELTDEEVSYDRSRTLGIPAGFPEDAMSAVKKVVAALSKQSKEKR